MAERSYAAFLASLEEKRAALDPKTVSRTLTRRSGIRSILGIGLDWAIVVLAAAFSEWAERAPWAYALAAVAIGTRMNAFYLEWLHEAVHANLFEKRRINELADFLFALPVFTGIEIVKGPHLAHHKDLLAEAASPSWGYDYWGLSGDGRESRARLLFVWWVRPFTGYQTYRWIKDTALDLVCNPRALIRCAVFWSLSLFVFHRLDALPLLGWYWFVPLLLVHPILYFWQDMAQHYAVYKSPTRDVRGLTYRLFFNPHGRGAYHNVHHHYPAVPWYMLSKASRLLIDDARIDLARGFMELSRQITCPRSEEEEAHGSTGRLAAALHPEILAEDPR